MYLTYADNVKIENPYIVTNLNLPGTTKASRSVQTELRNASNKPQTGVLRGRINLLKEIDFHTYKKQMPGQMPTIAFEKRVTIPAGKTLTVNFSPEEFAQLNVQKPHLCWPNGYGLQHLHPLTLTVEVGA